MLVWLARRRAPMVKWRSSAIGLGALREAPSSRTSITTGLLRTAFTASVSGVFRTARVAP